MQLLKIFIRFDCIDIFTQSYMLRNRFHFFPNVQFINGLDVNSSTHYHFLSHHRHHHLINSFSSFLSLHLPSWKFFLLLFPFTHWDFGFFPFIRWYKTFFLHSVESIGLNSFFCSKMRKEKNRDDDKDEDSEMRDDSEKERKEKKLQPVTRWYLMSS